MLSVPAVVSNAIDAEQSDARGMLDLVIKKSDAAELYPTVAIGVLTRLSEDSMLVLFKGENVERSCVLASSCLLKPQAGDLVSCLCYGDSVWIQHVLATAAGSFQASISIDQGKVSISADSISLSASSVIGIESDRYVQKSRMAKDCSDEKFSDVTGNRIEYSKNLVIRASQHANIKADSLTQVAVSLMKLDASQIHMG
jgi:hypothetical protein